MDNRVFNINGFTDDFLAATIELAFRQDELSSCNKTKCKGWRYSKKSGMILFSYGSGEGFNKLPEMNAKQVTPLVTAWLQSDEAKDVELGDWDEDPEDCDIHTTAGWRVFLEDWGHVEGHWGVICAIKPAFMWYGK